MLSEILKSPNRIPAKTVAGEVKSVKDGKAERRGLAVSCSAGTTRG